MQCFSRQSFDDHRIRNSFRLCLFRKFLGNVDGNLAIRFIKVAARAWMVAEMGIKNWRRSSWTASITTTTIIVIKAQISCGEKFGNFSKWKWMGFNWKNNIMCRIRSSRPILSSIEAHEESKLEPAVQILKTWILHAELQLILYIITLMLKARAVSCLKL